MLIESEKRAELEKKIKESVNATKKEFQRQLDTLKNKQIGPKWAAAWDNYNALQKLKKEQIALEGDLKALNAHERSIEPSVQFLNAIGYLNNSDPLTLKNEDLTLKGILATEVNEGHQILMTELYTRELLHTLSGEDIISVLACFQEGKETEESPSIYELNVSDNVKNTLNIVEDIIKEFSE
jgi:superfamily II RNA helicase